MVRGPEHLSKSGTTDRGARRGTVARAVGLMVAGPLWLATAAAGGCTPSPTEADRHAASTGGSPRSAAEEADGTHDTLGTADGVDALPVGDAGTESRGATASTPSGDASGLASRADPSPARGATDQPSAERGDTAPAVNERLLRLVDRLGGVYRRLYVRSEEAERTELLLELIAMDEPSLQSLGFELAQRELSAGRRLDDRVGSATLAQLRASEAAVRARAALLAGRLAPAGAGPRLGAALSAETDGAAASALLRAVVRWPEGIDPETVVRWLEAGSPARAEATEAAWAVEVHRGIDEPWRGIVLGLLRGKSDLELGADGLRLLLTLGDGDDRRRIERMLTHEDAAVRQAAAIAAEGAPTLTAPLLDAAASDPTLFDAAVRAVIARDPDAPMITRTAMLPAPSLAARAAALRRLADEARVLELVAAAESGVLPLGDAETLIGRLVEGPPAGREATPDVRSRAALRLAALRVEADEPETALAVLNASGLDDADVRIRGLKTVALLLLGEWEAAARIARSDIERVTAAGRAEQVRGEQGFALRAIESMSAAGPIAETGADGSEP